MTCLVFSDSHGRCDYIKKAMRRHPDAEIVFFLGDGIADILSVKLDFPDKAYLSAFGNCDYFREADGISVDEVGLVTLSGKRILYTHGHRMDVKFSLAGLSAAAVRCGADIVLFGHTHEKLERYIGEPLPLYLFNPGSIGMGEHTYGVLLLTGTEPLFSFGSVD